MLQVRATLPDARLELLDQQTPWTSLYCTIASQFANSHLRQQVAFVHTHGDCQAVRSICADRLRPTYTHLHTTLGGQNIVKLMSW